MAAITLEGSSPTESVGERFHFSGWEWKPVRMICEQVLEDTLPWGSVDASADEELVEVLANRLAGFLGDTGDDEFTHSLEGVEFSVTREKLEEFIAFLRVCGGFESL